MKGSILRCMLVAACALPIPTVAGAATDGTLGPTSTGSLSISATVPGRVKITGIEDVTFGTVDPASDASNAQDVCVWSNTPGRVYNITATGSGDSNAFTLTDGSETLTYGVEWADTSGQTTGTALTSGSALTAQSSTAIQPDCAAGPANSASLIVKMTAAQLQAAIASSYTGTLTLVVAPE